MQSHVSKWGNSLAVRLPAKLAKATHLSEGSAVQLEVKDGSLVLTKMLKKFKLSDLLADLPDRTEPAETDWGEPRGEEEW